jgi:hypothetical protein
MKHLVCLSLAVLFLHWCPLPAAAQHKRPPVFHLIFCSDVHYGLVKKNFRGRSNVTSEEVNRAMITAMETLPGLRLPADTGAGAGQLVSGIEAVAITGDICNRQEKGIQSATVSWQQFYQAYVQGLHLKRQDGQPAELCVIPGNHDISNAIGYTKPLKPATDKASLVGMYNLEMQPAVPKTARTFNPLVDKIHYARDIGGVHLLFVDAWPDSSERAWMARDLQQVPSTTPVLLFVHAMPDVESRFFTNPARKHKLSAKAGFQNLVNEVFKDGPTIRDSALIEQAALAAFLQQHPNIKAYFHGHVNYTEYYHWNGPKSTLRLPCFRVDSPMKGQYSSHKEDLLSFQLISIDNTTGRMTVRECLWNADPGKITWGAATTLSLR